MWFNFVNIVEKASEKLNNYLMALSSQKSDLPSEPKANGTTLMHMDRTSNQNEHQYMSESSLVMGTSDENDDCSGGAGAMDGDEHVATSNEFLDVQASHTINSTEPNSTQQIFFFPAENTSATMTNSRPPPMAMSNENSIDQQSTSSSSSSSSSSAAADIEIAQFINEMSDNLAVSAVTSATVASHQTMSAGSHSIGPVVASESSDFIASFLTSAAQSTHNNAQASDVFDPSQPSRISTNEPLISVNSGGMRIDKITCSFFLLFYRYLETLLK